MGKPATIGDPTGKVVRAVVSIGPALFTEFGVFLLKGGRWLVQGQGDTDTLMPYACELDVVAPVAGQEVKVWGTLEGPADGPGTYQVSLNVTVDGVAVAEGEEVLSGSLPADGIDVRRSLQ